MLLGAKWLNYSNSGDNIPGLFPSIWVLTGQLINAIHNSIYCVIHLLTDRQTTINPVYRTPMNSMCHSGKKACLKRWQNRYTSAELGWKRLRFWECALALWELRSLQPLRTGMGLQCSLLKAIQFSNTSKSIWNPGARKGTTQLWRTALMRRKKSTRKELGYITNF